MNKLRVGSCFSGVGFWEMALKQLDIPYTTQFCVEFDKYPYNSYKAIHGDVKNYGDVTKINGNEVEPIDLFFYSPPCQAFSVAGKGLGVDEHRGVLFFDSLRIIQAKQPKIAIMENVKGLTNKPHAETLQSMLTCLTMAGYTNYLKVLNTKDCGIPQNRDRVFIVSIRNDIDNGFDWPQKFDNGIRLKDLLETEVDEKFYISEEKCAKLISQIKSTDLNKYIGNTNPSGKRMNGQVYNGDTSPCITTNKGEGLKIVELCKIDENRHSSTMNSVVSVEGICACIDTMTGGNRQPKVCVPCLTPDRLDKRQNGRRFKYNGDPSFTLTSQDKHGVLIEEFGVVKVKEATKKGYAVAIPGDSINMEQPNSLTRRGRVGRGVAQTLTCGCNQAVVELNEIQVVGSLEHYGNDQMNRVHGVEGIAPTITVPTGGGREQKIYTNYRIRKLTPLECWRLQGATDEDFYKAAELIQTVSYTNKPGTAYR